MQEGTNSFVHALLNSTDFGDLNVVVKTTTIQLVLHQACIEMKEKFVDDLEAKNFLYSYYDAQYQVLDRFPNMVTHMYSLFELLEGDVVDLNLLREKLCTFNTPSNPNDASGSI
ncbi:unnamed protein product [Lactuca saligna]|uniref:Uncharacterized protein n=1 Tax=Lactuca saligna TaxID=75948 RepID=A0AA35V6X1_LACSI|nr:unnamed protein product [Lactuca saligna]